MAKEKESGNTQKEETQAKETQEDTQVEEQVELSDEQVVEQVSQLTESEEEVKEVQEETQTEETEEQTEEVQAEIPTIGDEMIKENNVLRSYYGKPVTILAPAYSRLVSKYTKNSQELAELKRQMAESSLQKTDDIPDMVEKPEEFKKWKEGFAKANQEIGAGQKQEPQIDVMVELAKRLPQGADVNAIVNGFLNENAERLFDDMGNFRLEMESLYQKNPEVLYKEVLKFHQNYEKENEDEAVARKAGHKKLKSDFKKARDSKKEAPGTQVNTISKDVKLTKEEEMLIEIQELVQED